MRLNQFFALCLLLPVLSPAQTIQQKMSASKIPVALSCVRSAASGKNRITWQTDYGSQERQICRQLTYSCSVRWSGPAATNALLDVWFVGVPGDGGAGKEIILGNELVELALIPNRTITTNVASDRIANDRAHYAALGITDASGAKLRGCVVQLLLGGEVVRSYSSEGHLQQAAWKAPFGSISDGTIGD
jgi:hypothetical protein